MGQLVTATSASAQAPIVVCAMGDPVTIARASEITGVPVKVIRRLYERDRKITPKASLVMDPRHPLLFELYEIQAALADRNQRRVVHTMNEAWG